MPNLKTALHSSYSSFEMASFIVEGAQKADNGKFVIPFIPNFEGKTPLHYCIEGDAEETRVADYFLMDFLS